MKRSAKWFLRETRRQVKANPLLPVRFDIDVKREGKAVNEAREELQRTPGQWTMAYGAYPDKRRPGMMRVAFIGPDRPQPIKIIRIPAVRADKQAVAGHVAALTQSRFYPRNSKSEDKPPRRPASPSDMWNLMPLEARAKFWTESDEMNRTREQYQRKFGSEFYVELFGPISGKGKPGWNIRVWRGEDWLMTKFAAFYPAEIAYALEQGEWAGSALATIEPLARNMNAQIERNRLNAPLAGHKRATCTDAEINTEFAAYKKRNPDHSYAAAEIKVADALKYSNHRKLGERIKRMTKTPPAKWYRSLR